MVIFHCYVSLPKVSFERYLNRCSSYFCAFSRGYSTQFNVLRVCVGRHKDILWPCCREREREREQKRKQAVYALLTLAFAWWMISNGLRTMLWRMNLPHSTNSKAHSPILPHSAVQRLIFTMSCRSKSAKLDARAQPWLVTQLPSSPETTGSDKARWTQLGAFFRCTTVAPPPLRNLT